MMSHATSDELDRIEPARIAQILADSPAMTTDILATIASDGSIFTHRNMVEAALIVLAPKAETLTDAQLVAICFNISDLNGHYLDSDAAETIRAACDRSGEDQANAGQYAGTANGWQPL